MIVLRPLNLYLSFHESGRIASHKPWRQSRKEKLGSHEINERFGAGLPESGFDIFEIIPLYSQRLATLYAGKQALVFSEGRRAQVLCICE